MPQVDKLADKLFKAGKIKNLYKEKDFFTRAIHLNQEFPGKGSVTNYVYKTRWVGGPKLSTFCQHL